MLEQTIQTLILHNTWRRGAETEMVNPKQIGIAIDHAIQVLMQVDNLLKQKDMGNIGIALKGLEIIAEAE